MTFLKYFKKIGKNIKYTMLYIQLQTKFLITCKKFQKHIKNNFLGITKKWHESNPLTSNIAKTKFINFSINSRGKPSQSIHLKIHKCQTAHFPCKCSTVAHTETIKYLGLYDQHIDEYNLTNNRWNGIDM